MVDGKNCAKVRKKKHMLNKLKKTQVMSFMLNKVFPAFMLVSTFFCFGTASIFIRNEAELWFFYGDIFPSLIVLSLFFLSTIILTGLLIPRNWQKYYQAFLYAMTFCFFIQGNILPNNYGTLNGDSIDWSAHRLSTFVSILVWFSVLAVVFLLMHKSEKKILAGCNYLLVVVLALQVVIIAYGRFADPERKADIDGSLLTDHAFDLSTGNNTIVFILDCFDASLFSELLENDEYQLQNKFEDFTFYRNMSGGATRTKYAMPYIFTGRTNTEPVTYPEYLKRSFSESPFVSALKSMDIDARLLTESCYVSMSEKDAFDNMTGSRTEISSKFKLALHFCKLTAFRYVAAPFKKRFWMYSGDFDKWKKNEGDGVSYVVNDVEFYHSMQNSVKASIKEDVFRLYHLFGPHGPHTMSEDCKRISVSEGTEERQALGVLRIVYEFICQLKRLGIYDKTTLFVMADHGGRGLEQNPLFMLKNRRETKLFSISDTPCSYKDMANIYRDAVLDIPIAIEKKYSHPNEERFFYYQQMTSKLNLVEYSSHGHASDQSGYKETGVVYHGNMTGNVDRYRIGMALSFANEETANPYCTKGFSKNEGTGTWTDETESEMFFPLSKRENKDLVLRMRYGTLLDNQRVYLYLNGHNVAQYIAVSGTKEVLIPKAYVDGEELHLWFDLPDAKSPRSIGMNSDSRVLCLDMKEIGFYYFDNKSFKNRLDTSKSEKEVLSEGFYDYEDGFVWIRPEASLTIKNRTIAKKGLQIELSIPNRIENLSPELRVIVNGIVLTRMNTTPGDISIYYPPKAVSSFDGLYDIRLEYDFSFIPKELEINNDTRELSLQVRYIGDKR